MKTFAVGDIHGAYKALLQVLEKSNFSKQEDRLICLGDVADGWSEVPECFDELLTINNLIYIMGNHDLWLYEWLKFGTSPDIWTQQGGQATIDAYIRRFEKEGNQFAKSHEYFLHKAPHYYIDEKNRLYVHGGFNWHIPIEENEPYDLRWNRHAYETACMWETYNKNSLYKSDKEKDSFKDYSEVFIGHTATNYSTNWRIPATDKPVHVANLWNLDQGAGWDGKLTLMNVDTKEYYQSDIVTTLYPESKGRN
jgi:serine/threonine protein phosphatase 1